METPPAPPPIDPGQTGASDPYYFLKDTPAPKKSLLPAVDSTAKRLLVVVMVLFVVIIIGILLMSLISGASSAKTADLIDIAKQQNEIIRVSAIGVDKSQDPQTKNLAITTTTSIQTDQTTLLKTISKLGASVSPKVLKLSQKASTDTLLTQASQANNFDDTFSQTLITLLGDYQIAIKKSFDSTTSKSTKAVLAIEYNNAGILLNNQKK